MESLEFIKILAKSKGVSVDEMITTLATIQIDCDELNSIQIDRY